MNLPAAFIAVTAILNYFLGVNFTIELKVSSNNKLFHFFLALEGLFIIDFLLNLGRKWPFREIGVLGFDYPEIFIFKRRGKFWLESLLLPVDLVLF